MNSPIDVVIPWVDDSDPEWRKQRDFWAKKTSYDKFEKSNVRFQSWDNLQYWFRSIETCMPWINKIFLPCHSTNRHDNYVVICNTKIRIGDYL